MSTLVEAPSAGRTVPGARTPVNRVDDERLLDAVRARVLTVGIRRTTLTDVAREAKVSRMTLYRRFPDVSSLVSALMTREFGGLLREVAAAEYPGNARARLVARGVATARRLAANEVLNSILDNDPELLRPYVFERVGTAQRLAQDFVRELLVAGHADGSIRPGDPDEQARVLLFVIQTFAFSQRAIGYGMRIEPLLAELGRHLDGALAPR